MGTVSTAVVDRRSFELEGWAVSLTTFRVGDTYVCQVDNVWPGAILARITAATQEEAEAQATAKASRLLARTKRRPLET